MGKLEETLRLEKTADELNLEKDILELTTKKFIDTDTRKQEKIFKETSLFSRLINKEYKQAKEELQSLSKEKVNHNDWLKLFEAKNNYKNKGY